MTAFDLDTRKTLYKVPTGHEPDAVVYDPFSKRILAFDGDSADVTVIDPKALAPLAVVAHIPLDGKPEFAACDEAGHVFVNIEDKNEIQQIDSKSLTVINSWKIDGQHPRGLAIDIDHHRLFAGCEGQMVILDAVSGKAIGTTAIGHGVDACCFDAVTQTAFASCGDGTLAVVKETSPGKFETIQTVLTKPLARTMALDASTHAIYIAFAEASPGQTTQSRPNIKPESFSILVVTPDK